ncbi:hypothetical protein L596_022228 [Steinernema carpocapsae]|uniref:Uncharacterized protein n=1 Tax=Steinernema carpocapsae TaxID=34508 RepID=A0A4U5MLY7_STECR|nr:hypothetical protein L596_022228 [Steinernema carpocapsae]
MYLVQSRAVWEESFCGAASRVMGWSQMHEGTRAFSNSNEFHYVTLKNLLMCNFNIYGLRLLLLVRFGIKN